MNKIIKTLTALALTAGLSTAAYGQSFTTPNVPVEIDFSGFQGTVDTLPSGMTFGYTPGEGGFFNYDDPPGLSGNSLFAFRESDSDPVIGWIYKRPASTPANIFVNLTYTNNTGVTINDFILSLDFLQVSEGSRPTELQINWNPSGSFTTNGITNGAAFVASTQTDTGTPTLLDPYVSESRIITYSSINGIAHGDSVIFGFNVRFGAGSGNNAHIGFGNATLTAVPEPSTYAAIVGLMALGLVLVRRQMRS